MTAGTYRSRKSITFKLTPACRTGDTKWSLEHVGMIRYSSYWGKYALVLDVNERDQIVTELDAFADINRNPSAAYTRTHRTPPERRDRFLTVAEYYAQVIDSK